MIDQGPGPVPNKAPFIQEADRQIGFFEKSGTVSKAALKSLVTVLQQTGELKGDLPPEKLVMPGVTEVGP